MPNSPTEEVLSVQFDLVPARNNLALLLAHRGCIAEANSVLAPARAAAENGPFAAEVAASWREIQLLGKSDTECRPP